MRATFAVVGLGRFGITVAQTLTKAGYPVLAIDSKKELIADLVNEVDATVCMDTTDKDALLEIDIAKYSCVIVGIGASSLEASILTTALLSQIGVPRIIARAIHELHGKVLTSVGAHEVINPEQEIGERLAYRLAQPGLIDQLALGDNIRLVEIEAPASFCDQTLAKLDIRNSHDVSIVAIHRDKKVIANPKGDEVIQPKDLMIVIGSPSSVGRLTNLV